ncbi:NADPH-dependent F420 reductase [Polyangium aurulentum]|uniref:NADPH-dependent F420 reductase n=1 Tax=Polyangium aurulentum TaxID=2567896 RepID=UPI0010AE05E9|nr:NADPH-dependent F420 reductase [Polyangium aurulentum]UQA56591.1 NADPH-dependent F420 reductase [Polyangium aurulentum]
MRIGIIGGTGREGRGLALRWAAKGHDVVLGSRDATRAQDKAREIAAELAGGSGTISGGSNEEAAGAGEIAVLTVPYAAHGDTLKGLRAQLAGRILVDITVPLVPPKVTQVHLPPGSAAALEAQALLDPSTRVVAALHHVSSAHLGDLGHGIDCDVLVCSDDTAARDTVIGLLGDLGLRGLDAGVLRNAVALEALTPVLLHINRKFKTNAGIRITGLP